MNIFMCWFGERSLKVATCLKKWLPDVIQSVAPWLSAADIEKGARWMLELSSRLEKVQMGIICLTPKNTQAPWLLFEAGALSKVVAASFVCPFLIGLEPTEVQGPLAQFQATRFAEEEVRRLLETINKLSGTPLEEARLDRTFSRVWPELQEKLKAIEAANVDQPVRPRPDSELLTEVLERVRSVERRIAEVVDVREAAQKWQTPAELLADMQHPPIDSWRLGERLKVARARMDKHEKADYLADEEPPEVTQS